MRLSCLIALFCYFVFPAFAAILGVDYGQQFSKAALVAPGIPFELVLTSESKRKDLSGLSIKDIPGTDGEIERSYGSATGSLCTRFPHTCLLNFKSLLGKSIDDTDVQEYLSMHFGINLIETKNNRQTVAFDLGSSGVFPVEELLAMCLNDIKSRASQDLSASTKNKNSFVENIAISVSPFASQSHRLSLLDAVDIAGMNAIGLVDDGVAVAINYASSRSFGNKKEYHIIYDMGAGSTKASLFSVFLNSTTNAIQIEIEGVGYDESLGGQLLTKSVFHILEEKFLASNTQYSHSDLSASPRALARLWESAEKTKTVLSANNEARVSIESFFEDIDFKTVITRVEFEEYNSDLMRRVTKPILDTLNNPLNNEIDSPITIDQLNSVILAGGSTRVPFVQSHLTTLVGERLIAKNINADESAVLGSTLRGVSIARAYKTKNIDVIERSLYNYDITYGTNDEDKMTIFPRGSIINNSTTVSLPSLSNKTDDFEVNLYENGRLLIRHQYKNIAKNIEKLNCESGFEYFGTFNLDGNRIMRLSKLEANCSIAEKSDSGFFGKFLKTSSSDTETSTEELESSNTATNTEEVKQSKASTKSKKITLSSSTKYPSSRPMGSATKEASFKKLLELNKKDNQRKRRDEIKNLLEGALYELRYYLEDDEVTENYPSEKIKEASILVSEYLEWIEFDSESLNSLVFESKLNEIKDIKKNIKKVIDINEVDLTGEAFAFLYNSGTGIIDLLGETFKNITKEIEFLEKKYDESDLSFDKESSKIKINFAVNSDNEIGDLTSSLKDDLVQIHDILKATDAKESENTLDTIGKVELYDLREKILSKVDSLQSIYNNLTEVHRRRSKLLNSKLERHNSKLRAKQSSTDSSFESTRVETSAETSSTTTDSHHDEL